MRVLNLILCAGISGCATLSPVALHDVQPGVVMRIRYGAPSTELRDAESASGVFYSLDANRLTLALGSSGDTTEYLRVPASDVRKAEVFEGHSRREGGRRGAAIGVLSATAVLLTTFRACPPGPADFMQVRWCGGTSSTLWKGGTIGAALGALIGTAVGTDRWRSVHPTSP